MSKLPLPVEEHFEVSALKDVEFNERELVFKTEVGFERWMEIGRSLRFVEGNIQWWLGDWVNYGERKYGDKYKEVAEVSGYAQHTLENAASVARRIETSRRREVLPFAHHAEVATLQPEAQDELLDRAEAESWKRDQVRREVRFYKQGIRRDKHQAAAHVASTVYQAVLADPPWPYQNIGVHGAADHHYETMTIDDICGLPDKIKLQIAKDAVLFLWATNPQIQEALRVVEAWGFCVGTGTRILTADLQWVPAESVCIGDRLLTFDENRRGNRRYFQWGTVLSTGIEQHECCEIALVDGRRLISTLDHPWLMRTSISGRESTMRWIKAGDVGHHLRHHARRFPLGLPEIVPPAQRDDTYAGGFLAGAFDGEGSLVKDKAGINFVQLNNAMLRTVEEMLTAKDYHFTRHSYDYRATHMVTIKGGSTEFFRFMASCRPPRLMDKWLHSDVGKISVYNRHTVNIEDVRSVGIRDVVTLMTDTGTYIAEGFGAHNTYKTNCVWIKTELKKPGSGFYVRGRHELLFIATRGSFTPLVDPKPPIGSVITAPVGEHSEKPEIVYELIETLYPGTSRIELFARASLPREGWSFWGDECPGN